MLQRGVGVLSGWNILTVEYRKNASSLVLALGLALTVQHSAAASAGQSDSGPVSCASTKQIGDTVGIVTDRKTGAKEQSLVEGRLAIVYREHVVGTLYIDDEGLRYIEIAPHAVVSGSDSIGQRGTVRPIPPGRVFDGDTRLRACRS